VAPPLRFRARAPEGALRPPARGRASTSAPRKKLDRLLDRRNEHPEHLPDIDRQIVASFERESAILVLDMCGFSRLTIRHGIIHYLAMIRRMQRTVLPLVTVGRGQLIKTEADNVFATFASVPHALKTARSIHAALARANAVLPEDWDVHVGIGIGYGKLLMIGHDDVYGSEMNLASKLGEDLAQAGDVLLTDAAFARLPSAGASGKRSFELAQARLGRLRFSYHRAKPAAPRRP
jgi:adenylate cyclase